MPKQFHEKLVPVRLEFVYDERGFGELSLMDGENCLDRYRCRTGSINTKGKLVNALKPINYIILDKSVNTCEFSMYVTIGHGWKIRLYIDLGVKGTKRTRLLIHPDGGEKINNGTRGCIGIQATDAISFRHELDKCIDDYGRLPVMVRKA